MTEDDLMMMTTTENNRFPDTFPFEFEASILWQHHLITINTLSLYIHYSDFIMFINYGGKRIYFSSVFCIIKSDRHTYTNGMPIQKQLGFFKKICQFLKQEAFIYLFTFLFHHSFVHLQWAGEAKLRQKQVESRIKNLNIIWVHITIMLVLS